MSQFDEIPLRPPLTEQSLSFAQRLGGGSPASNVPPKDPLGSNSLANRLAGNSDQRGGPSETPRAVNISTSNTNATNTNGNAGTSVSSPATDSRRSHSATSPTGSSQSTLPAQSPKQTAAQPQQQPQKTQQQPQQQQQQHQKTQQQPQQQKPQQPQPQQLKPQPPQQPSQPQQQKSQLQQQQSPSAPPSQARQTSPAARKLSQRPQARSTPSQSSEEPAPSRASTRELASPAAKKKESRKAAVKRSVDEGRLSIDIPGGLAYSTNAVMSEMERARAQDIISVLNRLPSSLTIGQFIKEYYNETPGKLMIGTSFDSFEENPFRKALRRTEEGIYRSPYQRLEYLAIAIYQLHPFKSPTMNYLFQKYLQQLSVAALLHDEEVTALQGHQDVGSIVLALNRPHTSYKAILQHYARTSDARATRSLESGTPPVKAIEATPAPHKMTEAEFLARMKVYFTPNEFGLEALRLELAKFEPKLELIQFRQRMADYATKLFIQCFQSKTPLKVQTKPVPFEDYADLPADDKGWAEFYGLIFERTFRMNPAVARDPLYRNGYPGGGRMKLLITFMLRKYNLKIEDFTKKTPGTELVYDAIVHHLNTVLPRVALDVIHRLIPNYYKDPTELNNVLGRITEFGRKEGSRTISDKKLQELGYVFNYPASNAAAAGSIASFSSHFTDPNVEMTTGHPNIPKINLSENCARYFERGQRLRMGLVSDESPMAQQVSEKEALQTQPQNQQKAPTPASAPQQQQPQAPTQQISQVERPPQQQQQPTQQLHQGQPAKAQQPKQAEQPTAQPVQVVPKVVKANQPVKQKQPPSSSDSVEPPAKRARTNPTPSPTTTNPPPPKPVAKQPPPKPAPKPTPKNIAKPVPIPKIAPKPIPTQAPQAPQRFSPPNSPRSIPPWAHNQNNNNNNNNHVSLSGHQLSRPTPPWASHSNPRFGSHPQTRSTRRQPDTSNHPSRPPWRDNNFRESNGGGGGGLSARLQPRNAD
ncbi:hypothetical protein TRVA0_042S00804 [Trichomonascus vanleenenianus]|uniref:uncharacterized protein n=1 Tax=Trichomonascus vanleenenianus TaxID=2268995 RepID=UPI003EC9BA2E